MKHTNRRVIFSRIGDGLTTDSAIRQDKQAFRNVSAGLKEQGLDSAVRMWQLDDWWYHTAQGGVYSSCVYNWSLPSDTLNPIGAGAS